MEKGRKEGTSKNAEEGVGSNPGVRWKEGHPENRSQGAKPAKAAPKASLTAGCYHRFHHRRRGVAALGVGKDIIMVSWERLDLAQGLIIYHNGAARLVRLRSVGDVRTTFSVGDRLADPDGVRLLVQVIPGQHQGLSASYPGISQQTKKDGPLMRQAFITELQEQLKLVFRVKLHQCDRYRNTSSGFDNLHVIGANKKFGPVAIAVEDAYLAAYSLQ